MRGYNQDVLRKHARHILSKLSTKDADLFGGNEELGNVVSVLRDLAEEQDRVDAEHARLNREQLPPEKPTTFSGRGYPIKSTDPRKRPVMEEIKRRTGANKVTCVRETSTHFVGCPMVKATAGRGGHFNPLPECWIPKEELRLS